MKTRYSSTFWRSTSISGRRFWIHAAESATPLRRFGVYAPSVYRLNAFTMGGFLLR